jgi:hypothetical protein
VPSIDTDIDRLYQLPPDRFTAERNALAKRAGPRAAEVRALTRPALPAWAVNQLYWRERKLYDALVERANDVRAAHTAVLTGKRADLRAAGKAHDDAVDRALKATLAIAAEDGHPVTDATRQAVASTLRAMPSDDPPGRLARALQPGGFEMLAGITPAAGPRAAARPASRQQPAPAPKAAAAKAPAKIARLREAAAAAVRAVRDAEQTARREEFEAARTARDAEKAAARVDAAREAVEQAQSELARAERDAAAAARKRDTAQSRAAAAQDALAAARAKAEAARNELDATG